ncbi:MAG TPA: DUF1761 domain-containing protein [Thermomicrobiales bacterium]|nr:DUF1761 domain-containing protein [Thermomicrobiales bacterium]
MGDVDINWLAVILAGIAGAGVSWLWFSKYLFRNRWMHLAGLTLERVERGTSVAAAITGVVSLLTAYVVAYVASLIEAHSGDGDLASALGAAFWLWFGIAAATVIVHDAFDQQPVTKMAISAGERLVTLMVMGFIIGLFGV